MTPPALLIRVHRLILCVGSVVNEKIPHEVMSHIANRGFTRCCSAVQIRRSRRWRVVYAEWRILSGNRNPNDVLIILVEFHLDCQCYPSSFLLSWHCRIIIMNGYDLCFMNILSQEKMDKYCTCLPSHRIQSQWQHCAELSCITMPIAKYKFLLSSIKTYPTVLTQNEYEYVRGTCGLEAYVQKF